MDDSLWEICTRGLPDCPPHLSSNTATQPLSGLAIHEISAGRWSPQTLDDLRAHVASRPDQRLIFYVHGNWMPVDDARNRGLAVYRRLSQFRSGQSICFVAFSWPSERREGFARDVIGKKTRLDSDAYYLAQVIDSLQLQQSVGFIGYSFGAAVVCGAQHLLAGGQLCGYQLPERTGGKHPMELSMIAPAFDRQELTRNGRYHLAVQQLDQVVNLYNSMDPILKRFRFFDRDHSPIAAGFAGLLEPRSTAPLSPNLRIQQYDCRCIGRTHAELDYLQCSHIRQAFENALGTQYLGP